MAIVFTTNVTISPYVDKVGAVIILLRNALVASGLWRVRGSGDGGSAFQLMGQTSGVGGSFDVLTAGFYNTYLGGGWPEFNTARSNTISRARAWIVLEEIASGRCLVYQRCAGTNQYDAASVTVAMATGVASSGANASTPPVLVNAGFLNGSAFNTSTYFGGTNLEDAVWGLVGNTTEWIMHVAVSDTLSAGNVAPWWFCVWNRSTNGQASAGMWESLVDADTGVIPLVASWGTWWKVWGNYTDSNTGPINGGSSNGGTGWRGGDGFGLCTIQVQNNIGLGSVPPLYQQINNAGFYRTERPWVLRPSVNSRHIGRLEHFYLNKVARNYPATYNINSASPRIALGQLIAPWAPGVSPQSAP